MNNKSYEKSAARVRQRPHKFRRFEKRHRGSTKVIAVSLAFIMFFSMLGANITSIVHLLEALAYSDNAYNGGTDKYFYADLTLYDYKTDSEIKGGGDSNVNNDGQNKNAVFNTALLESGYVDKAGSWGSLNYFPLYLGLQYGGQKNGEYGNQMIRDGTNSYKYSLTANSEGNSKYKHNDTNYGASGAFLNLVKEYRSDGELVQGNKNVEVKLPYFDKDFLDSKVEDVLTSDSITNLGLSSYKSSTLGSVSTGYKFGFRKDASDGYYRYISYNTAWQDTKGSAAVARCDGLSYDSVNKIYKVVNGTSSNVREDIHFDGTKPGFFPYHYINGGNKNFGYGAKFEIPFTMTSNGCVPTRDSNGNVTGLSSTPIKFEFSGDDDVWVFVDDYLVLDVGGAHGKVSGSVNFKYDGATVPTAHTDVVKTDNGYDRSYLNYDDPDNSDPSAGYHAGVNTSGYTKTLSALYDPDGINLYGDMSRQHKLTIYYLERGSLESNCEISFNLQVSDSLSVKNTYDDRLVNDSLKKAAKSAADKEAVQIVMASDSGTPAFDSPDLTDEIDDSINRTTYYTISYDTRHEAGGDEHGTIDDMEVKAGDKFTLPATGASYSAVESGKTVNYRLKGWATTAARTDCLTGTRKATGDATYYAVYEPAPPAPFDPPPPPILLNAAETGTTGNYGGSNAADRYEYSDGFFVNLTSKITPKDGWTVWANVKDLPDGQTADAPKSGTVTTAGSAVGNVWKNGDNMDFKYTPGYYWWDFGYNGTPYQVDSFVGGVYAYNKIPSDKFHSDINLKAWVEAYFNLYDKLCEFQSKFGLSQYETLISTYKGWVNSYKTMKYDGKASTASDGSTKSINDLISDIDNYITNNRTVSNAYSTDETVTFYVHTDVNTAPTVVSANSYSGSYSDGKNNAYNWGAMTAVSSFPEGTNPPTGYYWSITVPKYVVQTTVIPGVSTNENQPNTITISGPDSASLTATVADMEMIGDDDYPCWYADTNEQRGMTEGDTYAYSTANDVTFYVHTTSSTAPTVASSNSYGGYYTDGKSDTVSWGTMAAVSPLPDGANPDTGYYWSITVPQYVIRTTVADGSTSTRRLANNITISGADSESLTATAQEINAYGDDGYPCWYADTGEQRGITEAVTYEYSGSQVFWVYDTSGTAPVLYNVNPYTGNSGSPATLTHSADDPDGYYYGTMYTTVTKKVGGVEKASRSASVKFNSVTTNIDDISATVPCYFNTSSNAGWYNLVTAVVQVGRWGNGSTPKTWWYTMYLYVEKNSTSPLASSKDITGNPCTDLAMVAMSPEGISTITGNDGAQHSQFFYTFLPAVSGVNYRFVCVTNAPSNGDLGETISNITSDQLFNDSQQANTSANITWNVKNSDITSSDNSWAYPFTATAKSTERLGTTTPVVANSVRPGAITPFAVIPVEGVQAEPDEVDEPAEVNDEPADVSDEPAQTGDEPAEVNDEPAEGTENPDASADSGATYTAAQAAAVGKFFNPNAGTFKKANYTNFKLYADTTKKEESHWDYAIRQTDPNGRYNLMFGQMAKFTYQFNRGSNIKIAETGNSYDFNGYTNDISEGRTTGYGILAGSTKIYHTVVNNNTKYADVGTADTLTSSTALYNRYSTTWKVTDENKKTKGTLSSVDYGIERYTVGGNGTSFSLLVNDIDASARDTDENVSLTVEFTNSVRVGTLEIEKTLTDEALAKAVAYRNEASADSDDPVFYFTLTFHNVFGDAASNPVPYGGSYKYTTDGTNYTTKSTNAYKEGTVLIPIRFSDLYTHTKGQAASTAVKKTYKIKIEGIPVYSQYTLTEVSCDVPDMAFADYQLNGGTKTAVSNNSIEGTVTSTVDTGYRDGKSAPDNLDIQSDNILRTEDEIDHGILTATYYGVSDSASDFTITAVNDRAVLEAYIYIGKKINQLYYHTTHTTQGGAGDNPAGLYNRAVTVGGATSSENDYNGYEKATEAEQSFIYKIEQFADGANTATATPTATFYEVISFDKNASINTYYYKKIKADPNSDYRITELTDWSWKYTPAGLNVQSATKDNKVATVTSFGTVNFANEISTGVTYAGKLILNSVGNTPTGDQANSAILAFTNERDTGKKDIEGDTSIKRNQIYIKAS